MIDKKTNIHLKNEVCKILTNIGAIKFGTFKLTSGKISPYYRDLRIVPSFPDVFRKICDLYINYIREQLNDQKIDRVAGIPTGGTPFASVIAYVLKKPFMYIRKNPRAHGRQKRIEGVLTPGDRVLLIDDLITTGFSLEKSSRTVSDEGGIVEDVLVLLNRKEGGKTKLNSIGITLHSLLDIDEAVTTLYEIGTIDEKQLKTILKQVKK